MVVRARRSGRPAGWDTRLGARSKFKLSAGSKRFALISTKMHRSPSLSVSLAPSLALYISVPKAHSSLFCSVLPSLSLTSFRQSQIIHFAASKCINILPVAFVALIRLSPSDSSSSSYRLFVAHRFGLELLVDCCDCLANLSGLRCPVASSKLTRGRHLNRQAQMPAIGLPSQQKKLSKVCIVVGLNNINLRSVRKISEYLLRSKA